MFPYIKRKILYHERFMHNKVMYLEMFGKKYVICKKRKKK